MATTQNSVETDVEAQEQHKKDVVVTAYSDGDYDDEREFIADVFAGVSDTDLFKQETKETRTTKLEINIEGEDSNGRTQEINEEISPYLTTYKDALVNVLSEEQLPDWMTLVDEVKIETEYVNSPTNAVEGTIRNLFDADTLEDVEFGNYSETMWCGSWDRTIDDLSADADDGATITQYVRVLVDDISQQRVLTHQSERSRDNRYETEDERWSIQIKAHIEASSDEEVDAVSQRLVPPVYDTLSNLEGIEKARLTDCEKKVRTTGACYNI